MKMQLDLASLPPTLTPRQRTIAELAAVGKSQRQIAEELGTTVGNVSVLLSTVYAKVRDAQNIAALDAPSPEPPNVIQELDNKASLPDALTRILAALPERRRVAIDAAIWCTILCIKRLGAVECLDGMQALASLPVIRHAVQEALWAAGYEGHATNVERLIRKSGFVQTGGAWQPPTSSPLPAAGPETDDLLLAPHAAREGTAMSKIEFIDPTSIPAPVSQGSYAIRLAEAHSALQRACAQRQAIKINLDAMDRSATYANVYRTAAKALGIEIVCCASGTRQYVGTDGKTRKDRTTLYVRVVSSAKVSALVPGQRTGTAS